MIWDRGCYMAMEDNLICTKCGAELRAEDKFCRNCGERVPKVVEEDISEGVAESTVAEDVVLDNSVSENTKKYSTMDFKCEHCGKMIRTKDRNAEKVITCPNCGKEVKVPFDTKGCAIGCIGFLIAGAVLGLLMWLIFGEDEEKSSTQSNAVVNDADEVYANKYKNIDITQELRRSSENIIGSPDYQKSLKKGTATIILKQPVYMNDLAYMSAAYIKLFSRDDSVDRVYLNFYLPNMDVNKTTWATAAYHKDTPDSFTLSRPYWDSGKYILDNVTWEGWGKRSPKEVKADEYLASGMLLKKHYQAYSEYIKLKDDINKADLLEIISDKYGIDFNPEYYEKSNVESAKRLNEEFGGELVKKEDIRYKDGKYADMDIIEAYNLLPGYTYGYK